VGGGGYGHAANDILRCRIRQLALRHGLRHLSPISIKIKIHNLNGSTGARPTKTNSGNKKMLTFSGYRFLNADINDNRREEVFFIAQVLFFSYCFSCFI
jgi:hypothetical protein